MDTQCAHVQAVYILLNKVHPRCARAKGANKMHPHTRCTHTQGAPTRKVHPHTRCTHTQGAPTHKVHPHTRCTHTQGALSQAAPPQKPRDRQTESTETLRCDILSQIFSLQQELCCTIPVKCVEVRPPSNVHQTSTYANSNTFRPSESRVRRLEGKSSMDDSWSTGCVHIR